MNQRKFVKLNGVSIPSHSTNLIPFPGFPDFKIDVDNANVISYRRDPAGRRLKYSGPSNALNITVGGVVHSFTKNKVIQMINDHKKKLTSVTTILSKHASAPNLIDFGVSGYKIDVTSGNIISFKRSMVGKPLAWCATDDRGTMVTRISVKRGVTKTFTKKQVQAIIANLSSKAAPVEEAKPQKFVIFSTNNGTIVGTVDSDKLQDTLARAAESGFTDLTYASVVGSVRVETTRKLHFAKA